MARRALDVLGRERRARVEPPRDAADLADGKVDVPLVAVGRHGLDEPELDLVLVDLVVVVLVLLGLVRVRALAALLLLIDDLDAPAAAQLHRRRLGTGAVGAVAVERHGRVGAARRRRRSDVDLASQRSERVGGALVDRDVNRRRRVLERDVADRVGVVGEVADAGQERDVDLLGLEGGQGRELPRVDERGAGGGEGRGELVVVAGDGAL